MTRLTASFALIAVLGLAACQPSAEPSAADTGPDAAVTPLQSTAEMPADAPPQEEAMSEEDAPATDYASGEDASGACSDTLGAREAASLVSRCIAVSPATHPPCNAANSCAMIQGEIDRACGLYGPDEEKPAECAA
ncbi:hypothetical protein [Brevundimonas subvibrioides]|uniref:hypothetical protein n=1 Tax=Brevundimonas subvibrioides TaxID=74313 RepID=UPI0022B32D35|nr:hypothetical protein [Brevundimonas subvibrioides]